MKLLELHLAPSSNGIKVYIRPDHIESFSSSILEDENNNYEKIEVTRIYMSSLAKIYVLENVDEVKEQLKYY